MRIRLIILVTLATTMLMILLKVTMPVQASSMEPIQGRVHVAEKAPLNEACLNIPDRECVTLEQLFAQTNGDQWGNSDGWFQSPKPCEWYGITCRTDISGTEHIYGLNLSWNSLQGTMPAELGNLSALRLLDLSGNELTGSLPDEIGNMTDLRILNLSENQFAGQLPDSLSKLSHLELLHIFENKFVGNLPLSLTQLENLRNFKFQNTHLCIPNDNELNAWLDQIYYLSRPNASDCQSVNVTAKPLVLIYAVLDNDLSSEWGRLVNNAEEGVRNGAFDVKLLVDAKGENNSYEYTLEKNDDVNCPSLVTGDFDCNRYRWRQSLRVGFENSAQRDALISFVSNALLEYPKASHVVLSLVGHGSGWGANALPAQPRPWRAQSGLISDTLGGMLWDDTGSNGITVTQSLSTQALGSALSEIKRQTGRSIDLLYLDACSMAMAEVAYEVRGSVKTLLASENTKWAAFPYDQLLPWVAGMTDGSMLGEQWLASEADVLRQSPGHAFTYSLIDVTKIGRVLSATNQLAEAVSPLLPTMHMQLRDTFSQTSRFDTNYDGTIDGSDSYVDLYDFASQLASSFAAEQTVVKAAQEVQSAVQGAVITTTYSDNLAPGNLLSSPTWGVLGGLSVYLPLAVDEEKRIDLYTASNLDWAEKGTWDEFLADYWQSVADSIDPINISKCDHTSDCPSLNGWGSLPYTTSVQLYIPFIAR